MSIKKWLFIAFAAIIVLIPVYVAVSSQNVLNNGKLYKFKPEAYDPFDPFRGKYLMVNYETDNIPTKFDFKNGETVYVSIGVDKEGFAFFEEAFKSPPKDKDYVVSKIQGADFADEFREQLEEAFENEDIDVGSVDTRSRVDIDIPDNLNKFFINEDDALRAEDVLREERENIYIAVRVLDGEARLQDIFVYDQPILEYLDKK